MGKLEELTVHTQELIRTREMAYDKLLETSLTAHASKVQPAASSRR